MGERRGKRLEVLIEGSQVGAVEEDDRGRLSFTYREDWRDRTDAYPLSLSMPLTSRMHHDPIVRSFLWGLLPDNERVLERWARTYHVSAGNPFALLQHVGEDCAGAAQFATPERVDALVAGAGGVEWIDEGEIAERLRLLRRDPAAWHLASTGQFSLAGAQAKTALHFDPASGRWGDPWGTVPTTHILKPAVVGFDDHDLNEHLCLAAARRAGLPAAKSQVVSFRGERAIVVERYDRLRTGGTTIRIHQEDMCQALGIPPTLKYQSEGGPAPEQIVELLRAEVRPVSRTDEQIARFVDALAFNWIIAGTDAHAKNYSILLTDGQVRLAPVYDIASVMPYDDLPLAKLRLAMRIDREYRVGGVSGRHWRRFALKNGLDPDKTLNRLDELAARVPDSFEEAVQDDAVRAIDTDLPARLVERVSAHAERCRVALAAD